MITTTDRNNFEYETLMKVLAPHLTDQQKDSLVRFNKDALAFDSAYEGYHINQNDKNKRQMEKIFTRMVENENDMRSLLSDIYHETPAPETLVSTWDGGKEKVQRKNRLETITAINRMILLKYKGIKTQFASIEKQENLHRFDSDENTHNINIAEPLLTVSGDKEETLDEETLQSALLSHVLTYFPNHAHVIDNTNNELEEKINLAVEQARALGIKSQWALYDFLSLEVTQGWGCINQKDNLWMKNDYLSCKEYASPEMGLLALIHKFIEKQHANKNAIIALRG